MVDFKLSSVAIFLHFNSVVIAYLATNGSERILSRRRRRTILRKWNGVFVTSANRVFQQKSLNLRKKKIKKFLIKTCL